MTMVNGFDLVLSFLLRLLSRKQPSNNKDREQKEQGPKPYFSERVSVCGRSLIARSYLLWKSNTIRQHLFL